MNSPLISIVTPTFNRIHLLDDTIESVLRQTYPHWEFIIVDDGSTDPIQAKVESYNDARIRFHAFGHSANYAIARNRGLRFLRGDYVAFLDSDDTWSPERLACIVEVFISNATSQFILNNVSFVGDTISNSPDYITRHGLSLFKDLIHERNIVYYPSALVFKKEILNTLHSLDESLPTGADHDFILRMAAEFPGSFINERLTQIHKHEANTSSKGTIGIYTDSVDHVKRFYEAGRLTRKDYTRLAAGYYYKLGLILLKSRDRRSSTYFQKSIGARPVQPKAWIRYFQSLFF